MKNLSLIFVLLFTVAIFAGCDKRDKASTDENKDNTPQLSQTENPHNPPVTKNSDTLNNPPKETPKSNGHIMNIETNMGLIKARLYADKVPNTVARIEELVNKGFYNGVIFHRVIDGFMLQGGDPTGTGRSGSGVKMKDEFGAGLSHSKPGMLSMANSGPNTGDSQFFITLVPTEYLDGKHAIFGEVIEGMDVVKKIGKVKTDHAKGDRPIEDVIMKKVTMTEK
ncbi:hypothetical protein BH10BAC5_BH10BAC5_21190 [soil metagenome]